MMDVVGPVAEGEEPPAEEEVGKELDAEQFDKGAGAVEGHD